MEKRPSILLFVFGFLMLVSVAITAVRFFIFRDYKISAEVSCDPSEKSCFARPCESEKASCKEGEKYQYYTTIQKKASDVSGCPTDDSGNCVSMRCNVGESDCFEASCTSDTVLEGEYCSDNGGLVE